MKRIALLLVMVLVLSMTFSSCGVVWQFTEPANAEELWDRIDKQMESLRSYSMELEADYNCKTEGLELTGEYIGNAVYVSDLFGNMKHVYEHAETTMKINGEEYTTETLIAYDDGWMYVRNGLNEDRSSIRSEITQEDFEDFMSEKESIDWSPEDAGKIEMVKNEDSTWEMTYSEFPEARKTKILDSFGFSKDTFDISADDVTIHVVADRWFRVTELSLEIFANSVKTPFVSVKATYGSFNRAKAEKINTNRFNEVDDARVVDLVYDKLRNVLFEDSGKIQTSLKQRITYNSQSSEAYAHTESDEITFANKDGSFSFRMVSDYNGISRTTEYKDGLWKIYSLTQMEQHKRTDAEARSAILSIVNVGGYDKMYVRDIELIGNGKYRIVARMQDVSRLEQIMKSLEDTYVGYDFYFVASIDDGELTSLEGKLIIHGVTYSYELSTVVSFDSSAGINKPSEI